MGVRGVDVDLGNSQVRLLGLAAASLQRRTRSSLVTAVPGAPATLCFRRQIGIIPQNKALKDAHAATTKSISITVKTPAVGTPIAPIGGMARFDEALENPEAEQKTTGKNSNCDGTS